MVTQKPESAARIEAHVKPDVKQLLQEAAALEDRSLTDFIIATVQAEAYRVIERHRVLKLSRDDANAFVEAILNPPEPNDALKAAFREHKQVFGDRLCSICR